jgi:choline kinase
MKGVIIAAGYGSRLWNVTNNVPKTLLPYGEGTILSTIISRLQAAGVSSIYLIVGYNQQYIRDYVAETHFDLPIQLVDNQLWDRGNGLSVYQVKDYIHDEPFILSMSDHIVDFQAIRKMVAASLRTNLLLVDPFIQDNFDIEDATKVLEADNRILAIGKNLIDYNALDCGIFRLEPDFFAAVESALERGEESISAAIGELVKADRMQVLKVDTTHAWLDIDTPEAYAYARQNPLP